MPPLLVYAAGAVLAGLGYRFLKSEWRRVNRELDENEKVAKVDDGQKPARTLRRDPESGVWRERA